MNISFPVPAFNSGIDTEVALFNYMVILYLILLGTAVLFSTVAVPFYIPATCRSASLVAQMVKNLPAMQETQV